MLIASMTYEEIYREIRSDFSDVLERCRQIIKPAIGKLALKTAASRYPVRHVYAWEHPQSHNAYYYLAIVKKHSLWDKPEITVFCEVQRKEGKEIIVPAIGKDIYTFRNEVIISVFQPHFLQRYAERFIDNEEFKEDRVMHFLIRNAYAIALGEKLASVKELQKIDPELSNESLLNFDGLCLGKRSKENRNIIIYKTFVPINQLYPKQYEVVMRQYLQIYYTAACLDYPQCQATIKQICDEGIEKIQSILLGDNSLTTEERLKAYTDEYEQTCRKLCKYIIL